MKSKINEKPEIQAYPVIMHSRSGNVVLFSEATKGVLLSSTHETGRIGEFSENFEMNKFEVFHGEVTVSN